MSLAVLLLLLAASSSNTDAQHVRGAHSVSGDDAGGHRQHRLQQELAVASELSSTNPDESLSSVEAVLREEPTLGQAHYQRGLVLWKLGRNGEAVSALDNAIEIEPRNAEFLDERGVAAGTMGDDISAEQFFRRAVAADADFVRSRSNLAFALMQLHRKTEARAELNAALRLDPTNRLCADRLRQVEAELHAWEGDETDFDSHTFESPWLQVRRQTQLERQRQRTSPPPPPPPPFHPRHGRPSDLNAALKDLTLGDIENLGAMFYLMRSAESYDRDNKELLRRNFDLTAITTSDPSIAARKPYVMGLAVDMIGYQLTAEERSGLAAPASDLASGSGGGLSVSSVEQIVSRLDRWGLAVLPSTIPEHLCQAAEQSILRSLAAPDYGFSAIYNTDHRYDYPLRIGDAFDGSPEQQVLRSLSKLLEPALTQARIHDF
jgi:tetratricopeptide (TPR) repeat protein